MHVPGWIANRSLMTKCLALAVIPTLLVGGVWAGIQLSTSQTMAQKQYETTLKTVLKPFQRLAAPLIIKRNADALSRLAHELVIGELKGVQFLCTYGDNNLIVSRYVGTGVSQACPDTLPSDASSSIEDGHIAFIQTFDAEGISTDFADRTIGGVFVLVATPHSLLPNVSGVDAMALFFAVCVAGGIVWLLQRSIREPLYRISEGVSHMRDPHSGHFHIKQDTHEEYGEISSNINLLYDEVNRFRKHFDQCIAEKVSHIHQAKEAADSANKSKSEFLSNMSHELRTPVHAIINFSEFLMKEMDTMPRPQVEKYLRNMFTSGNRLIGLLNNLLDLTRFDTGSVNFNLEDNNLWSIVNISVEDFHPLAIEKKITLQLEKPKIPTMIECDSDRMIQVIHNILTYILSCCKDGNVIKLEMLAAQCHGEPAVEIKIADQTPPLSPFEMESLFEKFSSNTLTKTGKGFISIGLSIAREIVAAHRGKIEARANEEGGTTFVVIIPIHQPREQGAVA